MNSHRTSSCFRQAVYFNIEIIYRLTLRLLSLPLFLFSNRLLGFFVNINNVFKTTVIIINLIKNIRDL